MDDEVSEQLSLQTAINRASQNCYAYVNFEFVSFGVLF